MEALLGFVIALAISITGVGAGSMTTPLLILLLGVDPTSAVGTALAFGAIVKVISIPAYTTRQQVNWRVLAFLLGGGIPGVIGGGYLLHFLKNSQFADTLYVALGVLIALTASFHLYRMFRPKPRPSHNDRARILPWLALPIGAEVGFSSAGAGALGSLLLFSMTRLSTTEIVGTDLCFGLVLSALGSFIQLSAGHYEGALLVKLVAGGVCGAIAGSVLAGKIAQAPMRLAVLLLLIVLGVQLGWRGHSRALPVHAAILR